MDPSGKSVRNQSDDVVLAIKKLPKIEEVAPDQRETKNSKEVSGFLVSLIRDSEYSSPGSCSFSKESEPSQAERNNDSTSSLMISTFFNNNNTSPKLTTFNSPSPKKDKQKTPLSSLSRSTFSNPKSRFVEPHYPNTPLVQDRVSNSPYRGGTPKPSATPKSTIEEEEEEIYKVEGSKKQRKLGVRFLIEWLVFILTTSCLICSLTVNKLENDMIWGLEIWKWCLMVLVIFCGRLVTSWLMSMIVFLIERNFLLRKKVLYFVYGLRKSVQVSLWFGLVLLSWFLMFDYHRADRTKTSKKILTDFSRALAACLVGSVIWLVKTLLVKILASSFHVNTFFDRIQESIFHQYILETLSGLPVMELAQTIGSSNSKRSGQLSFRTEVGKKGQEGKQGVIDVDKLHMMKQEKVSAWTMKRLVNIVTGSGLSTISSAIDELVDEESEQKEEINSELEAKAAAYTIFNNVANHGEKYIDEEDLLRFLSKEEVNIVFPQFEGAVETRKIQKLAFRNWVVKAYLERKSLAHSLNDTKTVVKQLHKLATGIVIIINLIVFLLFMGFATIQVLVFISSQLLLVAFMFGNTLKTIFEGIIFVFSMHPFDVGDRCVIDGVQMIVEEMNILTTVFLRYDNEKIYYPNAVLSTKPISNFYRSPDMGDAVEFAVDVSTSVESIGALKARIQMYIESKPQHWHPKHSVVVKEIENVNKMKMALHVSHTMNHQNMGEKNSRRSDLVFELKKIFEEFGIKYHLLPQEIYLNYSGSLPSATHS